jgi:hypothetical protein
VPTRLTAREAYRVFDFELRQNRERRTERLELERLLENENRLHGLEAHVTDAPWFISFDL